MQKWEDEGEEEAKKKVSHDRGCMNLLTQEGVSNPIGGTTIRLKFLEGHSSYLGLRNLRSRHRSKSPEAIQ